DFQKLIADEQAEHPFDIPAENPAPQYDTDPILEIFAPVKQPAKTSVPAVKPRALAQEPAATGMYEELLFLNNEPPNAKPVAQAAPALEQVPAAEQTPAPAPEPEAEEAPAPEGPPKTLLINFNNVGIIEYIRFISRVTNRNFIFDEADLQ